MYPGKKYQTLQAKRQICSRVQEINLEDSQRADKRIEEETLSAKTATLSGTRIVSPVQRVEQSSVDEAHWPDCGKAD